MTEWKEALEGNCSSVFESKSAKHDEVTHRLALQEACQLRMVSGLLVVILCAPSACMVWLSSWVSTVQVCKCKFCARVCLPMFLGSCALALMCSPAHPCCSAVCRQSSSVGVSCPLGAILKSMINPVR